jgi:hypothetical protein
MATGSAELAVGHKRALSAAARKRHRRLTKAQATATANANAPRLVLTAGKGTSAGAHRDGIGRIRAASDIESQAITAGEAMLRTAVDAVDLDTGQQRGLSAAAVRDRISAEKQARMTAAAAAAFEKKRQRLMIKAARKRNRRFSKARAAAKASAGTPRQPNAVSTTGACWAPIVAAVSLMGAAAGYAIAEDIAEVASAVVTNNVFGGEPVSCAGTGAHWGGSGTGFDVRDCGSFAQAGVDVTISASRQPVADSPSRERWAPALAAVSVVGASLGCTIAEHVANDASVAILDVAQPDAHIVDSTLVCKVDRSGATCIKRSTAALSFEQLAKRAQIIAAGVAQAAAEELAWRAYVESLMAEIDGLNTLEDGLAADAASLLKSVEASRVA